MAFGISRRVALLLLVLPVECCLAAAEPAKAPAFSATPALDLGGTHDFAAAESLSDQAAGQLPGLCSLAEFRALPAADRHVYAFDPWPAANNDLQETYYSFNFRVGSGAAAVSQKVLFVPGGGGPGGVKPLARGKEAGGGYSLRGFQNLDWTGVATHSFRFDKPVRAFGVVLKSSGDMELRKFYWPAAHERNGFPISYTLSDGSIVQLGAREVRGALLKGESSAFVGVVDRSGRGIVSVSYTLRGLAGNKAQSLSIPAMAFVSLPRPAEAQVISLRGSCDFEMPETIAQQPAPVLPGLATLDAFRFIVGSHRYVYRFDTWPKTTPVSGPSLEFPFDVRGKGAAGEKMKVSVKGSAGAVQVARKVLKDTEGLSYAALAAGDIGGGRWVEQTLSFEKPVWAFGATYRSSGEAKLGGETPVSYTLGDGTVVKLAALEQASTLSAGSKTFVGLIDRSDKGIASVTLRIEGGAAAQQPLYLEEVAFALAGPPPGDWKLTLSDEFDGDKLNDNIWSTGYKFADVINNELQGYVPENVSVASGICTIKAEHRDCQNTDRFGNKKAQQKFASGAFTSVDKFTQTYGYFEARLKMPKARGAGVWPAFWMLPDRGRAYPENVRYAYRTANYGTGVEIDIFEFMPWWKRLDGTFPIHMGCIWSYAPVSEKDPAPHGYGAYALENDGWGPAELNFPSLDSEFHTYGLYWSPERLIFYVDSKPVFRVRDPKHVPDVPHFFLFNVAVHGNGWGKSPDKKHPTMEQIVADMPNQMEIDYFRAYSGVLEEAIPTAASDVPRPVTKYSPPAKDAAKQGASTSTPASSTATTPEGPGNAPAAPVNSGISTPAN